MLTCSGVNVAVLRNERVSAHAWRGQMPRGMGPSSAVVINISSSWNHCGRARAHGTTNPNQYRIFATLPTSVQFPLPFWPAALYRHTQPYSSKFLYASNSPHWLHIRNKLATITACNPKRRVQIPAGNPTMTVFRVFSQLASKNADNVPPISHRMCSTTTSVKFLAHHHPVTWCHIVWACSLTVSLNKRL